MGCGEYRVVAGSGVFAHLGPCVLDRLGCVSEVKGVHGICVSEVKGVHGICVSEVKAVHGIHLRSCASENTKVSVNMSCKRIQEKCQHRKDGNIALQLHASLVFAIVIPRTSRAVNGRAGARCSQTRQLFTNRSGRSHRPSGRPPGAVGSGRISPARSNLTPRLSANEYAASDDGEVWAEESTRE